MPKDTNVPRTIRTLERTIATAREGFNRVDSVSPRTPAIQAQRAQYARIMATAYASLFTIHTGWTELDADARTWARIAQVCEEAAHV